MRNPRAANDEERPLYGAGEGGEPPALTLPPVARRRPLGRLLQRAPLLGLLAYYVFLVAGMGALIATVPVAHRAYLSPLVVSEGAGKKEILKEVEREGFSAHGAASAGELTERTVTTLFVILGTLLLVIPVAKVYMLTKPLRYDEAVVRSVIILPIVVAGIAMVVVHSIALAFGLAGIVAAVRFRNTLKDPRDAVYIFLVIAIGLAAGVQALDVALVTSFAFNVVVLALWWYGIGTIYGGSYGRTGVLAVGDGALRVARERDASGRIRRALLGYADDMEPDGILLVHTQDAEQARETVQEVFDEMAKEWRLAGIVPRGEGFSTLEYLVRLREKATAPELVGALHERWTAQVAAAEYIPFRVRRETRVEDQTEEGENT
jgi:hypothetical protein